MPCVCNFAKILLNLNCLSKFKDACESGGKFAGKFFTKKLDEVLRIVPSDRYIPIHPDTSSIEQKEKPKEVWDVLATDQNYIFRGLRPRLPSLLAAVT
jgi:hypothetical protein